MADVAIISMLMSLAASVSKTVAATPGWDFMPAPTTLTRAMAGSPVTAAAPSSEAWTSQISTARTMSSWGTVKEMSVTPAAEVFWTMRSTLMSALARARQ